MLYETFLSSIISHRKHAQKLVPAYSYAVIAIIAIGKLVAEASTITLISDVC